MYNFAIIDHNDIVVRLTTANNAIVALIGEHSASREAQAILYSPDVVPVQVGWFYNGTTFVEPSTDNEKEEE